jgi:hypothetical protein
VATPVRVEGETKETVRMCGLVVELRTPGKKRTMDEHVLMALQANELHGMSSARCVNRGLARGYFRWSSDDCAPLLV